MINIELRSQMEKTVHATTDYLSNALGRLVSSNGPDLLLCAVLFLLLSVLLRWKSPDLVLRKMAPSGLMVNAQTYIFDALFVAVPLGALIAWLTASILQYEIRLLEPTIFARAPPLIIIFVAVFVGDAIGYFRHRLEHSSLLWPFHALHHSDTEMNWFTLFRFHPFNRLTTAVIDLCLLAIIGFPAWAIAAAALVRHYYGMWIHADVPWTYGPLGKIFVSPAMHRWHHVLEGQGVHSNYATIFTVFDQLFKTYHLPGPCSAPLGVKGVDHRSFVKQMIYPISQLVRRKEGVTGQEPIKADV
jgi:sterol desaturase/sphingolipid hydroxylase (fatty acid hydroxylase superfamily)